MTEVLGIFQIGPVQEFIACARKTQDFWSGSYLVSFLNCIAIDDVIRSCGENKQVIIYPSLDNQELFGYVQNLRKKGEKPWESPPSEAQLRPTVPNRFVCKLDKEQAPKFLQQAEEALTNYFSSFAKRVREKLEKEINYQFPENNPIQARDIWNSIWARQSKKFFEIYWAISPLSDNYPGSYQQAEALFGARKAIRDFDPISEPGYKCTLCGQNEPLNAQPNGSLDRKKLREFWDKIRDATGYRFREEEHLCALCTTKRLAPYYIFSRPADFPSTASVAVADFVAETLEESKNVAAFLVEGKDLVSDFIQKVNKAKKVYKQVGLDFSVEPLPKQRTLPKFPHHLGLAELDGDWLIQDTYGNIPRRHPEYDPADLKNAKGPLESLVKKVKELRRNKGLVSFGPGKYYAVFQMDGDNIGEVLEQKHSEGEHRQFSQLLCNFSLNITPDIIESKHLGKIIYFGGDEGVAFVSLREALSVIEECHQSFKNQVTDTTASIGAVIAHYEQPLQQVLLELQQTVKKVKDWGKNGFCIALMKRSGGTSHAMARWEYNGLAVIPILKELSQNYEIGKISDRWYYQFADEELGLKESPRNTINVEAAQSELNRLILRHIDKNKVGLTQINQLIERLKKLIYHVNGINGWDYFMALMDVGAYIGRGGGH